MKNKAWTSSKIKGVKEIKLGLHTKRVLTLFHTPHTLKRSHHA